MRVTTTTQYLLICLLLITCGLTANAQDPQFSQFYAAPTYLNPAFAGMTTQDRISANYRHQWPSIPGAFVTYNAAYDHNIDLASSGVGILFNHDKAGSGGLSMTSVNAMYAYEFRLKRYLFARAGFQMGYYRRFIDFNRLVFSDQLVRGGAQFPTSEAWFDEPNNFVDMSTGGLIYGRKAWFGIAAHHLNQPDQSLLGSGSSLPLKYSAHGGYRTTIKEKTVGKKRLRRDIVVAVNYKAQAKFDQLDVGFYYEPEPMVVGIWYRGIPLLKAYEPGYMNNDAVIVMVGYHWEKFKIGYSYDMTISRLVTNTGGSHELSIVYEWANPRKRVERRRKPVPCAKF